MDKFDNNIYLSEGKNKTFSLIIILALAFSGFQFFGPLIGILFTLPFFDFDIAQSFQVLTDPLGHNEAKVPIFIIQGLASILGFIAIPWVYLKYIEKKTLGIFFNTIALHSVPVLLTALSVLFFMFINSIFIEWNANLELPEFLSSIEEQLKQLEENARRQTEFLTGFDSNGHFMLAFFVIAIIPAIGEELLFRGFVQNLLNRITGNIHVAIWVAGFLFSAFHLQFYGLVPRMLLGVLFGYLYHWSGSLSTAMIAHFVNNGFTLIMMYLYQKSITSFDVETEETLPYSYLLIFSALFIGVIYSFRNFFGKNRLSG